MDPVNERYPHASMGSIMFFGSRTLDHSTYFMTLTFIGPHRYPRLNTVAQPNLVITCNYKRGRRKQFCLKYMMYSSGKQGCTATGCTATAPVPVPHCQWHWDSGSGTASGTGRSPGPIHTHGGESGWLSF